MHLDAASLFAGWMARHARTDRRMDPQAHVPAATWPCRRGVERRVSTLRDEEAAQSAESIHVAGALRVRGGMLPADEVALRMRPHYDQPISQLARWIVRRAIVVVPAKACTLVPLFQFDQMRMTVKVEVSAALAELVSVFDDLEVATWFVEPNRWLGGLAPVEGLRQGLVAMLQAARTDRFIARG